MPAVFRVRRSCRRASYGPAGTLRRAGWLAAMRTMAIERLLMQVVMNLYYGKLTLVKCLEIYHIESCSSNLRFDVLQGFPSIVVLATRYKIYISTNATRAMLGILRDLIMLTNTPSSHRP